MPASKRTAILLISCPDQPGIVSAVSSFIGKHNGNIVYLDQHVDSRAELFFMRVEWESENLALSDELFLETFSNEIAIDLKLDWQIHYSDQIPRTAIFVTKDAHCLYDLLSRHESGELKLEIPLIIGNHDSLEDVAQRFGIPFFLFKITKENKTEQEEAEIALLKKHNIDTIILARYMQILSDQMCKDFFGQIINIHHSFLPSFKGAKPYHQAYQKGVKILGATAHYVSSDLDEGPIIDQSVERVDHSKTPKDLELIGRDLESITLARAVKYHIERRVFINNLKTVIFS